MSSRLPDHERLPRPWVEAWRSDEADAAQLRRAYLRFLGTRRPARLRATAWQVSRWVLVGVAIGMGSVYAATGPLRLLGRSHDAVAVQAPQPAAARGRATGALTSSVRPPEALSPSVTAPPASTSSSPIDVAPPSSLPAASTSEQWQRAARGLRDRDFGTANAALDELAKNGSDAERESARLVQAQLLISQGRSSEAASLLHSLVGSAHSSSVRQKSTELLAQLNESRPSQRSFAPTEGTNTP